MRVLLKGSGRIRDEAHLAFIRQLPCLRCLHWPGVDAAHIKFSDARIAKPINGHHKADDCYVLPLCRRCHELQHKIGEPIFWSSCGDQITVLAWALALYAFTGEAEKAERVVRAAHETMQVF